MAWYWFSSVTDPDTHAAPIIRSGDKLILRQAQSSNARGGINVNFSDGSTAGWHATDSGGSYVNSWTVTDQIWHLRTVDLSTWAGKTVSAVYVGVDNQSQTGAWWELIADAVIAHNDGTLVPLYNGQGSFAFGGPTVGPGMSGVSYLDRHLQNIGHTTATTTYYYHGDQISSSRLMTSPFGEPVWNATYLPYGEEYNPEITVNDRKFTGKEHDTESGLDYFGARYYGSALGRFITPDWAAKATAVPYASFSDPQSLNLYAYVRNAPSEKVDIDGHCYPLCTAAIGAGLGALTGAAGEFIREKARGEKADPGRIVHAAIGGAVAGAISGVAGPEAGLAAKVILGAAGSVAGGGAERALNGQKVIDGKAIAVDAVSGGLGGAAEKGLEKAIPSVTNAMNGAVGSGYTYYADAAAENTVRNAVRTAANAAAGTANEAAKGLVKDEQQHNSAPPATNPTPPPARSVDPRKK